MKTIFRFLTFQKHAQNEAPIVADDDYEDVYDGDSAFGAFSDTTDTASMTSSIMKFREENGRTYHSFGRYHTFRPKRISN